MKKIYERIRKFRRDHKKKLRIYDFDHTLVHTNSKIRLKKTGKPIPQSEYDKLVKLKGYIERDIYDFSDYKRIIEPRIIETVFQKFMWDWKAGFDCQILTARSDSKLISDFIFSNFGIKIPVTAVNSDKLCDNRSDPEKKADWIEQKLKNGHENVILYEDSLDNGKAVFNLKNKYPQCLIEIFIVDKNDQIKPIKSYL